MVNRIIDPSTTIHPREMPIKLMDMKVTAMDTSRMLPSKSQVSLTILMVTRPMDTQATTRGMAMSTDTLPTTTSLDQSTTTIQSTDTTSQVHTMDFHTLEMPIPKGTTKHGQTNSKTLAKSVQMSLITSTTISSAVREDATQPQISTLPNTSDLLPNKSKTDFGMKLPKTLSVEVGCR